MASRPRLPTPRSAVEPSRQVPGGGEPPGARGSAPSAPPERSTTSVCAAADADRHTNAPRTSADPAMVFMAVPPGFPERKPITGGAARSSELGGSSVAARPRTGELTQCRAFLDRRRGGILPASSKRFHRAGELRIDWTEPLLRRSAMGVASSGGTDGMPVTGSYVEVTGPRWSVRTATKAFPQPW